MGYTKEASDSVTNLAAASVLAMIYLFAGVFLLVGWAIWNGRKRHEFDVLYGEEKIETTPERVQAPRAPPKRLFGAISQPGWLLTYEHWLYRVEQITGMETTTRPRVILFWCLLLSLSPAVVIGLPASVLLVEAQGLPLLGLMILGGGVGVLAANSLSQPAAGWFGAGKPSETQPHPRPDIDEDYISLGNEVDDYW